MQSNEEITVARIYYGDMPRYSRKGQQSDCEAAVAELGVPAEHYEANEFDRLVLDLEDNQVAVVATLMTLAEKKPKDERPGVAFFRRVMRLWDAAGCIIDVETGVTSNDGDPWYDLVSSCARKIMRGRPLSKKDAKFLNKMSQEAREPGLENEWKSPRRQKDRDRMATHWQSTRFKNAAAAIAATPNEFAELRGAHRSTWERIFGGRTKRSKKRIK